MVIFSSFQGLLEGSTHYAGQLLALSEGLGHVAICWLFGSKKYASIDEFCYARYFMSHDDKHFKKHNNKKTLYKLYMYDKNTTLLNP